ncbi:retrovirus-related Pol polyprotein from transposon 412 [Trichonephila clavipes]|nr:retrovirus-related Pol polyprotein from transposon 412 [Trichonephila clavipes]
MDLFLTLFEWQMKLLDLAEDLWIPFLIGALPTDGTSLITREPEEKCRDYSHFRGMLPQRGPRRHVKASETVNDGRQVSFRKSERPTKTEYSHQVPNERSPLTCYGCGKQGVINSRCNTCNLNASKRTDVATNHINAYKAQIGSSRLTLIDITFCGIKGRVCADTSSSHSIAGERMFQIFKDKGLLFQETTLAISLADGQQTTDVKNTFWYFWENPTHKYPFGEELDTPYIVENMSNNTCQLRERDGECMTSAQKEKLNLLLESFKDVFEPGGEATNILEHHINTRNSPPISVHPYRMSPVKNCPDCIKYKASNQKPSELLQTPVPAQCFESLAIDLFGPLTEIKDGKRWILIIEDCTTEWVELSALPNATAKECAITLIEEILLRDLKPRLEILVQDKHDCCSEKLPFIHFALNTAKCETAGQTAAFLNFGRELRTPSEVVNDIQVNIQNYKFVPEDSRKFYADKKRKAAPTYQPGEHVFVAPHPLSNAAQGRSAKLMSRRDGPYVILTQRSPSSYEIASIDNPEVPLGVYHTSALTPCTNDKLKPLIPLRKRGRPAKVTQTPGSSSGRRQNQRGRM